MRERKNRLAAWVTMSVAALAAVIPLSVIPLGEGEPAKYGMDAQAEVSDISAPPPESEAGEELQAGFRLLSVSADQIYRGDLILVNNEQPYRFPETESIQPVLEHKNDAYRVKDSLVSLQEHVISPLNALFAAYNQEGRENDLLVISGYRSQEHQQELMDRRVEEQGAQEAAAWVAAPGGSEHHTGLALDLSLYNPFTGMGQDYTGEGDYAWINAHCSEYGFVIRFPQGKQEQTGIQYEPWHLRYVGPVHAAAMVENGFCLEEYIDFLRNYPFDGEHLQVKSAGGEYEVYFVPCPGLEVQVPIPEAGAYTLSGNNVDGFVVAAALSEELLPESAGDGEKAAG